MSLYERNGIWWISICHKGRRIQQSTGTKDKVAAQQYHDEVKARLWKKSRLNEIPDYTWNDAVVRYLKESISKRSLETDKIRLRWLHKELNNVLLKDIDRDFIDAIAEKKKEEGRKTSTLNRYLALIRVILRKSEREWKWLERAPTVSLTAENNKRERYLTYAQAEQLKRTLPPHVADAAEFTLNTGLRESNVAQLEWSEVDFNRRHAIIPAHKFKTGKALGVPLNSAAMAVIRRQIGQHPKYVFTYKGKPIKRFNNEAWRNALKKLGITNFRWHDLRHTWASWHIQNGTSLYELQQLAGWSCYSMAQRYSHLSSDHLKAAANRVTNLLHGNFEVIEGKAKNA